MLVVLCAERDCDFSFGFIMAAHKVVLFVITLLPFSIILITITQQREANKKLNGFYLLLQALKA